MSVDIVAKKKISDWKSRTSPVNSKDADTIECMRDSISGAK
jgi:hypothetical protein